MIEFLMLIGMALLITLVMVAGFWVGFKIVVSWQNQHRRHTQWMKEQLRNRE